MKRHDTYREMRDTWGELLFFVRPKREDYTGLDEWDMPPDLVAVFRTEGGPAKLICYAKHGRDHWYPNNGERYAIAELIKALSEGVELLEIVAGGMDVVWPFIDKWKKRESNQNENG